MVLLVLFIAYALQVRYRPYLSPEEKADVVREHVYRASIGDSVHTRLASLVRAVEAHGKKTTRKGRLDVDKPKGAFLAAAALWGYLFNYNTVEMVLLFSCCLIALCGIMFESGQLQASAFTSQKYSITVFVILIILGSIFYCEPVCVCVCFCAVCVVMRVCWCRFLCWRVCIPRVCGCFLDSPGCVVPMQFSLWWLLRSTSSPSSRN